MKRLTRLATCLCLAALAAQSSPARYAEPQRTRRPRSQRQQTRRPQPQPTPAPTPTPTPSPTPEQPHEAGSLDRPRVTIPRRKDGEMLRATLTRIDCLQGSNVLFNVRAGVRVLRLHADSLDRVQFVSYVPSLTGAQLGCGARKPENLVYVTFRRPPDPKSKFDGEIIAVDFITPDIELEPEEKP